MSTTHYPDQYLLLNDQQTKQLSLVLEIEGLTDRLATGPLYKRVRYGDEIAFGDDGLVYGGLMLRDNVRSYISLDSALQIAQRLEPEQGKASISTFSIVCVDKDGYMSKLISPGILLDEPLGNKKVRVYLGYQNSSFPEDYFTVFRGYIASVTSTPGKVSLSFADGNLKRRSQIFYTPKTKTTNRIHYRSVQVGDLIFQARQNTDAPLTLHSLGVSGTPTITYEETAFAGVPFTGYVVRFMDATANQLKEAVEKDATASVVFQVELVDGADGEAVQGQFGSLSTGTGTTVNVGLNGDFHKAILGPDGTYDTSVRTLIRVDGELMEYTAAGIGANSFVVTRGDSPAIHEPGTEVSAAVELEGHAIDLALKIMLSGWNGPWISGVAVKSFVKTGDPDLGPLTNAVRLPDSVDAVEDYGLVTGDYVTVSGSGAGNNGTGKIIGFEAVNGLPNRVILTDQSYTTEEDASGASLAFRSQFDVYPTSCGLKLTPNEVSVQDHLDIRQKYLTQNDAMMRFLITAPQGGKEFIEKELFHPVGLYALTRYGKLSVGITRPPVAGEKLPIVDASSVISPETISVTRSITSRRYFNEIQYSYDYSEDGSATKTLRVLDSDSISKVAISSVLPIEAKGVRSDLSGDLLAARRGRALLSRYKNAAYEIQLKVNWRTGSLIEVGDVVVLVDEGDLQIIDFDTGNRGFGKRLFEVIDRSPDIKTGTVSLKLLSGLGFDLSDRYATVSPSSLVGEGSTTASVVITPSFGEAFGSKEYLKWKDHLGLPIVVHSYDWSRSEQVTLQGIDLTANNTLMVTPALSFTPQAGDIVDIAPYPETADPEEQELYKLLYAHFTPTLTVTGGTSSTVFSVSLSDAAKLTEGLPVIIHSGDYSTASPEVFVESVSGTSVTVKKSLGFTPSAGMRIELVGFKDGGGPYRWL